MLEIREQIRQHAAWVEEQMPPLVLPAEAARTVEPFEPIGRNRHKGWGSRRVWTVMAAAAVLALLVAGLAVLRSHPGQPDATDPAAGRVGAGGDLTRKRAPPAVDARGCAARGRHDLCAARSSAARPGVRRAGRHAALRGRPASRSWRSRSSRAGPGRASTAESTRPCAACRASSRRRGAHDDHQCRWHCVYDRQDSTDDRYSWYERDAFITARFRDVTATEALGDHRWRCSGRRRTRSTDSRWRTRPA